MKVHILSLQRTGSKSLQTAIHRALSNPLAFNTRLGTQELAEYFHGWGFTGYKYGGNARIPADPDTAVLFRTHPDFKNYFGSSFIPTTSDEFLMWEPYPYQEQLTYEHLAYLRVLLDKFHYRNYVVKTQITTLLEDVEAKAKASDIVDLVTRGSDVLINLVPSDIVKWLCSNYACDATGIFVPCPEQKAARESTKLTMPYDYVKKQLDRLSVHSFVTARFKNIHTISTDSMAETSTQRLLSELVGGNVVIPNVKEFSADGYEKLFTNYGEIREMIESFKRTHIPMFPLTYPIA